MNVIKIVIMILMVAVCNAENIDSKMKIEHVINYLNSPNANTRSEAVNELGRRKDKRAIDPLLSKLNDKDNKVRTAAACTLSSFNVEKVETALIKSLSDEYWNVRSIAASSLARVSYLPYCGLSHFFMSFSQASNLTHTTST